MSGLQQYLRLFDEQRALIDGNSCAPLNAHRDDARRFLSGVDLPNRKTERYKYTNASAIFADEYHSDFTRTLDGLRPGDDRGCAVPNLATVPVHVINDVVVPLADDVELPEGVRLLSLCRAAAEHPEWLERYYDRAAHHEPANQHKHADREERDVVTRLNTLFAQDGLLIHVAAGVQMERTVQIVFRSRAAVDLLSHRRLLIVAEAGASVNVLVCEHADGTHRYLTTQVTEIYADDVRCNHGSTIGKLDESALLYLRQRGIPLAEARLLLQHAFVAEVLQRVPSEALRDRLSDLVERRFRGEQRHCADGCEECAVKF